MPCYSIAYWQARDPTEPRPEERRMAVMEQQKRGAGRPRKPSEKLNKNKDPPGSGEPGGSVIRDVWEIPAGKLRIRPAFGGRAGPIRPPWGPQNRWRGWRPEGGRRRRIRPAG